MTSPSFRKRQRAFILQLAVLSAVLFLLHSYLLSSLAPDSIFVIPIWQVYLFHVITVLLVYGIINYRYTMGKTQLFNAFIVLMVLKMVLVVVFLLPLFLSEVGHKIGDAVNFFIPYFIFLAFEVFSITSFLQSDEPS